MARPVVVDVARWLWISSALLGMLQVVIDLTNREALVARVRQTNPSLGQDQVDTSVNAGVVFALLLAGLFTMLYAKLANRMAWGRNWARIVLTALGAVSVAFSLFQLAGMRLTSVDLVITVVGTGVDSTAITLMFLPSASAHFRRRVSVDRGSDQS